MSIWQTEQDGLQRAVVLAAVGVTALLLVILLVVGLTQQSKPSSEDSASSNQRPTPAIGYKDLGDLEVEIKIPESLKELTVATTQTVAGTVVGVSTAAIAAQAPECAADKNAALGQVAKLPGAYLGESPSNPGVGMLVRQFDGYYIHYTAPQTPCTNNAETLKSIESMVIPFKNALTSVRQIKAN